MTKKMTVNTDNKEDALAKIEDNSKEIETQKNTSSLVELYSNISSDFDKVYANKLQKLSKELAKCPDIEKAVQQLPEEYQENVSDFIDRLSGNDDSMLLSNDILTITELRLYHGTGSDPLRPYNIIKGNYYLTSGDILNKEFIGIPIVAWKGMTMWPEYTSKGGAPICKSMDGIMGSTFGLCASCPNRVWKSKDEPAPCRPNIAVFMLQKDFKDLVLVRFSKTSSAAGNNLLKLMKYSRPVWKHWFKLTVIQNDNDKYKMQASRSYDEGMVETPKECHDLCKYLSLKLKETSIIPDTAWVYQRAQEALEETSTGISTSAGNTGPTTEEDIDYSSMDSMDDAPEV